MRTPFYIIKTFVKNLTLNVPDIQDRPCAPVPKPGIRLHVDVKSNQLEDNCFYLVEIIVNISSIIVKRRPMLKLKLQYDAMVEIPDDIAANSDQSEMLKEQVPINLLDNIRSIIYQLTSAAGFPIMLGDNSFDNLKENDHVIISEPQRNSKRKLRSINQQTKVLHESEKIDFNWLIKFKWAKDDKETLESAQNFWATYMNFLSNWGVEAIEDYDSMPIYKFYYRFLVPIEYHHPNFEECDESIWPILFQMLYGSFKSECNVIDYEQGLPEIEFTYEDFQHRTISSLSFDDFIKLLSDLTTEALVDLSVPLLDFLSKKALSEELTPICQLKSEKDFYHLFKANSIDTNASFLTSMYKRIKECNLQTLLYQS